MKEHDETKHLLSTAANKERLLEDVFNDEKRQGVKELIDKHKQESFVEKMIPLQLKYNLAMLDVMKKETLEEASWKHNPLKKLDGEFLRHAFKEGAKWQAERMYSEEDMKAAFNANPDYWIIFEEFIQQFKKKQDETTM
jgi:hypothetical protein